MSRRAGGGDGRDRHGHRGRERPRVVARARRRGERVERDCLRYELELTLADETTGPDRAATTHATGVEWVSEGLGLVRSVMDDGSHLGPRLTLTALRDP